MTRPAVLLSLDWLRPKDPRTSLGHASLLTCLAGSPGVDVLAVSRAVNDLAFDPGELLDTLLDLSLLRADIAIGVYVWNEPVVQWLLPALRRGGFKGRLILGGPQLSYAPPGVLELYPDADIAIRGYAEEALATVLAEPGRQAVPGVVRRGAVDLGDSAGLDLRSQPSPILRGTLPVQPFMRWETQRGCIYACSFCQHREASQRPRARALGEGRIAKEVEALVNGGALDIAVLDPIFHTNPAAVDILHRFASLGYRGRLSLQSRFELVDDEFLDACEGLDVRLEFGLQTTEIAEMRAVRRINDLGAADRVIRQLHQRGLSFEVSLIYGLPHQTLSSFQASVSWCQERGVPVLRAFPLMLLRGTQMHRDRERWGLIENEDPIPVVVRSNSFNEEDWQQMSHIAASLTTGGPVGLQDAA